MPHKVKATPVVKTDACQQYLAGALSIADISKALHVDQKSVSEWITLYRAEGKEGLTPQGRNRVYPAELKLAAVMDYLSGEGSLQWYSGEKSGLCRHRY